MIRLHYCKLVFPALRLNWNHVLNTLTVEGNIDFVDLDLTNALNGGAHVVLKGVSRYSEEHIDQTVVSDLCQQCLLVIECIGTDNLWRCIWNLNRPQLGLGRILLAGTRQNL